jgi:tetratricopeptide (TPR) repeat protein
MRRLIIMLVAVGLPLAAGPATADSLDDVRSGNAAFGAGRYEEAVEVYTRAVLAGDLEPEALAIAFNNRGVAYNELGDYDKAIQDYGQALALAPGDKTATKNLRNAHIRRGGAAQQLGEQDAALADYARAVELEPGHPLAYRRRGQLLLEQGDAAAALADLRRAEELDPGNPDAAALLADAERAAVETQAAPEAGTASQTAAAAAAAAAGAEPPAPPAASPPAPEAGNATVELAPPPAVPSPEPVRPPQAAGPPAAAVEPGAGLNPQVAAAEGSGQRYEVLTDVNYRQGPGNQYRRLGALARGSTVAVFGEDKGWLQIRAPNGDTGFVYSKWLRAAP